MPTPDFERPDFERRRRGKNLALAALLFGVAALFFVMTIVKWHS